MNTRVALLLSLLTALPAAAAEEEDGALVEKVAVRNRLFTTRGRFELGLNLGFAVLTQLTEHYTANLNVSYNFVETFAVELLAGGSYTRHTSLARDVADQFSMSTIRTADDLSGLWELVANGTLGLRWQFLYGKIGGLLQDVLFGNPIHFQFYVSAGGGAGFFKRESVVICNQTSTGTVGGECLSYLQQTKAGPLVTLALGWRFFLPVVGNHHSLRLEVRDFSYLDGFLVGVNRQAALNPGTPTGGGTEPSSPGITNLVQVHAGYSYLF
jgi:outer membrane beta-barrel protein